MNARTALPQIRAAPTELRAVAPDIHSLLPRGASTQLYDRFASAYDGLAGTRLYNRIVWGNTPAHYSTFAARAVYEPSDGWLLDAGGGSVLFTADAHAARTDRPILVLDQSLAMLTRARRRLIERARSMPDHVLLVQADLRDLSAFRQSSFSTVLCLNVLHHIEDATALLSGLRTLLAPGACLFLTSLIRRRTMRNLYLRTLRHAAGFAAPRTEQEVLACLGAAGLAATECWVQGSMLYAVAHA